MTRKSAFNYSTLNEKHRTPTQAHALKIHDIISETAEGIVEIGKRLLTVKKTVGIRLFNEWLKGEFRWSQATASNYMRTAEKFGDLDCVRNFQPSALVQFVRDRIPKAAVVEAVIRMSSDRQEASPDQQREAVKKLAKEHGYKIIREYFDSGISGADTKKRKSFLKMISDAEKLKDFEVILCWDQDRFGRFGPTEANYYWYIIREAGVFIHALRELSTPPTWAIGSKQALNNTAKLSTSLICLET